MPDEKEINEAKAQSEALKKKAADWLQRVEQVKDARVLWEAKVATCMHFAEGRQQVWWDEKGNMREKEKENHEVYRIINLFPTALGIIQSRLTSNDPRWNPRKSGLNNVSQEEIDAADALLQEAWEGEKYGEYSMKRALKQIIRSGWLQGGRLAYIRFDESLGVPVLESYPLWDVYWDLSSPHMTEKQWLDIATPTSVDMIKKQMKASEDKEGWNQAAVHAMVADEKLAMSGLQQQFKQRITGRSNLNAGTIILHQCFEIIDGKMQFCMVADNDIIYTQELPYSSLCEIFDVFRPVEEESYYPKPPCWDWIDPQKTVNVMFSSIENYISTHLQGRFILRDKKTVVPRAGVHGQKIYAEPGEVAELPLQPLPNTHFAHLNSAISQFEQISGVHSESLGRLSGSADSGVAISQLQAIDEQNSADAVENYKLFIKRIGAKMLNCASKHWSDVRTIYRYDKKLGMEKSYKVIGEGYNDDSVRATEEGTVSIRPFTRLDTEIVVGNFFSSSEKRRQLTEFFQTYPLGQNPAMDQVVLPILIDAFDIGVGKDIVKQMNKLQNPSMMIAEGKAGVIMEGEEIPIHPDDDHAFLAQFYQGKAETEMEKGDEQGARSLLNQAQKHNIYLQATNTEMPDPTSIPQ